MGVALAELCFAALPSGILVTDVAVYFDSKLRKLKLQTYLSVSPAKMREKPPGNAENRENGVWRGGKYPSLAENAAKMRSGPHLAISVSRTTKTPVTKYWV